MFLGSTVRLWDFISSSFYPPNTTLRTFLSCLYVSCVFHPHSEDTWLLIDRNLKPMKILNVIPVIHVVALKVDGLLPPSITETALTALTVLTTDSRRTPCISSAGLGGSSSQARGGSRC